MPKYLTLDDVKVKDKVVLVRVDLNSPLDPHTHQILEDTRIRAHAETTIKELVEKGAKVVILAHQGRKGDPEFIQLKQHAQILGKILRNPVIYVDDLFGERAKSSINALKSGEILVLENVRTFPIETKEGTPGDHAQTELVRKLAPLSDIFVNDAFSAAHRAHVSIIGFTQILPSVAGRIMEKELELLNKIVENPEKPCVFILGGAKADDSLEIANYVLEKRIANYILTGGVIGQLFLAARGLDLGSGNMTFLEKNDLVRLIPGIKELMQKYRENVKTPDDVAADVLGKRKEISVEQLPTDYLLFDIGANTVRNYSQIINKARSIVVSGPMGKYEDKQFAYGTRKVFEKIAASKAFSLAGGGHTIAAIEQFGLTSKISYISTAGGALIEFLMGKKLPGVVALEKAAARKPCADDIHRLP